jgi:hypothetical protein
MFAHKSVPHLSSQHALACMAKTLSFHISVVCRRRDTDRIIAISVAPPKVAKASTNFVIVAGVIALTFANVSTD